MTKEEIVSLIEKDFSTKKVADYLTDMPTDVKTLFSYLDNKFEHKSTSVGMPVKFDNPRVRDFFHLAHRAINGRQYGDNDIDYKAIFIKKHGQKTYDAILKVLDNYRIYLKNGAFLNIDTAKFGAGKIERIVFMFPQIYGGIESNVDLYLALKEKYANQLDEWELSFISEVENIIEQKENKEMAQKGNVTNDELDKAVSDLHRAETLQETMKKANAIIRSKKNVTERLISEAGMSESSAIKAQQPDYAGRVGFATYQLTNNNASIKRLQERVKMLEKKVEGAKAAESGAEEKYTFDGGVIKVNYEEDRVQILLDSVRADKPMYQMFRKNGYVFSPTNKAFQRKITPQAIRNAVQLMKATKVVSEDTQLEKIVPEKIAEEKVRFKKGDRVVLDSDPKGTKGTVTNVMSVGETIKDVMVKWDSQDEIDFVKPYDIILTQPEAKVEGEIFYTVAPENYFGFGAKKTEDTEWLDRNNRKIIKVFIPDASFEWNKNRLSSGNFSIMDENVFSNYINTTSEFHKEEIIEPNTGDEFDDVIMSNIDPHDDWKGNLIKERDVYNQIRKQLNGDSPIEITNEAKRILNIYSNKFKGRELTDEFKNVEKQNDLDYPSTLVDLTETKESVNFLDELHPLDLWKRFDGDGRWYRKFEFPVNDSRIREITDMGIKERMTTRKGGGYDAIISVDSMSWGDEISKTYVKLFPIEGMITDKLEEKKAAKKMNAEFDAENKDKYYTNEKGEVVRSEINELKEFMENGIKKSGSLKDGDHIQYEFDVHEISKSFNHRLVGTIEKNPDDKYSAMYMNEMYEENYIEKDFKRFEDAEKWVLSGIEKDIKEYKEDFDTRYEKEVEHEVKKEDYDYNNPIKRESVSIKEVFQGDGVKQIKFEFDGKFYKWEYRFSPNGGGIHIWKFPSEKDLKANQFTTGIKEEIIYNTYNSKQSTDDGKFIEYSISQWNKKEFFKQSELDKIPVVVKEEPITDFKGINYSYKNQYELNKAIEALLIERAGTTLYNDSSEYTSDEKNFIRKYSGYGGLDKYGTTGKGGLFEYYTPKEIIERMWALAYKYGYNNGSVLEPSIGIGEFLQYAPKDARIVGYEINEFSAKICKILYPTAEVNVQPFEKTFISKNNWTMKDNLGSLQKFDLVIGNPPYGDFSIVESRYMSGMGEKDHTKARNYVEYFIRRGLDLLKSGGLLIYIVGAQLKNGGNMFLDSGETPVKDYLAANCELLDAYRLPDSVFERTGVTSDILILKKR